MYFFLVLASDFHSWATVCGKWRNFTWNHRENRQVCMILSLMQCVPAKCPTPFHLPVPFLCVGGMELVIDVWCFYMQTWTLGFWLIWKQVLPLHLLYFTYFRGHCSEATTRALHFRYVASSCLCSLGSRLLISVFKRDLSRSSIHHLPFPRIIVVLACNWKDLFLPDTWYCFI